MKSFQKYILQFKWIYSIVAFLLVSISANAQIEPMFTQYMFNETFINPAYVGSHEYLSATLLYRDQWVGIEGSPKTQTLSVHAPVNDRKIGLGLSFMKESIGVSDKIVVNGSFAYRILMPTGTLAFGVQAGFVNDQENLTSLHTNVSGDNQFSSNVKKYFLPNAGFGVYYKTDRYYAGFSIPRLLENKFNIANSEVVTHNIGNFKIWHYYLAAGYVFDLNSNLKFKPSAMLKALVNAPMEIDLNADVLINDLIWAGLGYRTGDAVSALVGIQLNKNLKIHYSYDYTLTALQTFNNGSHEFSIIYDVSLNKDKIVSPRFF